MSLKAGRFGVNRKSVDRKGNVQATVADIPEATPGNIGGVEFNSTDANKVLAVKSDGTGLEWVDKSQGGGGEWPARGYVVTGKVITSGGKIAEGDGCIVVAELPDIEYQSTFHIGARLTISESFGASTNVRVYAATSLDIGSSATGVATQYLNFLADLSKQSAFSFTLANPKYVILYHSALTSEKFVSLAVSILD